VVPGARGNALGHPRARCRRYERLLAASPTPVASLREAAGSPTTAVSSLREAIGSPAHGGVVIPRVAWRRSATFHSARISERSGSCPRYPLRGWLARFSLTPSPRNHSCSRPSNQHVVLACTSAGERRQPPCVAAHLRVGRLESNGLFRCLHTLRFPVRETTRSTTPGSLSSLRGSLGSVAYCGVFVAKGHCLLPRAAVSSLREAIGSLAHGGVLVARSHSSLCPQRCRRCERPLAPSPTAVSSLREAIGSLAHGGVIVARHHWLPLARRCRRSVNRLAQVPHVGPARKSPDALAHAHGTRYEGG
jgi:hypothetical protein